MDGLALLIDFGVKRVVREKLEAFGLHKDDADVISREFTKEFVENLPRNILKNRRAKDTVKAEIDKFSTPSPRKHAVKKNYREIKKIIENSSSENIKHNVENFVTQNTEYKKLAKTDVDQIIKSVRLRKIIKDDLDTHSKSPSHFSKPTLEKLKKIKYAFLTNKKEFLKIMKNISNRSEEVFALILEYPGNYESDLFRDHDVPIPVISIQATELADKGLVIKDTYSVPGHYVYLYPKFTQREIFKGMENLKGYELALRGKFLDNGNTIILENYEKITLKFDELNERLNKYIGSIVIIKGQLEGETFIVNSLAIVEHKERQELITKYE